MAEQPVENKTAGEVITLPLGDILTEEETDSSYDLILWNVPVTLMSYVTWVLKRVFAYSKEKSHRIMMTVHTEGRAVAWTGSRVEAEHYCAKVHGLGLMATVERSE